LIEGGSYYQVRTNNLGGQVNHMPAWDAIQKSGILLGRLNAVDVRYRKSGPIIPMSEGRLIAPALCMSNEDHKNTLTHGNRLSGAARTAQTTLISQGMFLEAQQLDVDDVRRIAPGKYEKGIAQMRNYTYQLMNRFPHLFRTQPLLSGGL
jgi:hypothetical protein